MRLPGTGLGLSICSRLSDMMGGSLTAVSELGLGTSITFEITLPTAEDPAEAPVSLSGNAMIYVQSSVPEIVSNLCGWLRRWARRRCPILPQAARASTPPFCCGHGRTRRNPLTGQAPP